jgi:hypothetical protein
MVTTTRWTPALARCPAPSRPARRCTGCGRTEAAERRQIDRRRPNLPQGQRWLASGDLDVAWLIPVGRSFTEARFCHACAPVGPVLDVACAGCGDGPLVLLDQTLPGMPAEARARERALAHLRRTGWRVEDEVALVCPGCRDGQHG